jgi:hypothetical protein
MYPKNCRAGSSAQPALAIRPAVRFARGIGKRDEGPSAAAFPPAQTSQNGRVQPRFDHSEIALNLIEVQSIA